MNDKWWIGKEIEGRLYGIETAFIGGILPMEIFVHITSNFHHILIGTKTIDELEETDKKMFTWNDVIQAIKKNIDVTIEAMPNQICKLPHFIKLKAHILLWIDIPELIELKDTDSVKLCIQNHDMYIYTIFNGQRITRKDYLHDRYR